MTPHLWHLSDLTQLSQAWPNFCYLYSPTPVNKLWCVNSTEFPLKEICEAVKILNLCLVCLNSSFNEKPFVSSVKQQCLGWVGLGWVVVAWHAYRFAGESLEWHALFVFVWHTFSIKNRLLKCVILKQLAHWQPNCRPIERNFSWRMYRVAKLQKN